MTRPKDSVTCYSERSYKESTGPGGVPQVTAKFDCAECPFHRTRTFRGAGDLKTKAIGLILALLEQRRPACATVKRRRPGTSR